VVTQLLGKRWSPEQVAHELRNRFPDQSSRHLCTESNYQGIYDPMCPSPDPPNAAAAADAAADAPRAWSGAGG